MCVVIYFNEICIKNPLILKKKKDSCGSFEMMTLCLSCKESECLDWEKKS
jgi:hypothetical protein